MKTNNIIILVVGIILLGGSFFFLKSQKQELQNPSGSSVLPSGAQTTVKSFELVVKNKKLFSGPETVRVNEGDHVGLKITSDIPEELHLHGYDISVDLEKDVPAKLSFVASISGRFVFELEKSKTDLGAVEVQPK